MLDGDLAFLGYGHLEVG